MNMKLFLFILLMSAATVLTSCGDSHATLSAGHAEADEHGPENGAQFKEGKGVALTDLMAKSIGLQTADVTEEKIAPSFTISVQAMQHGTEAVGWLTQAQAAKVQPGLAVSLDSLQAIVLSVEKTPYPALGDFEVRLQTRVSIEAGIAIQATFRFPAGDAVTSIPKSALLTTAEGTFVYAKNDSFYLRTPVKVGAMSDQLVEITDGLYAGDEVVIKPVMSLWMAELQVLRGGKACTCGH